MAEIAEKKFERFLDVSLKIRAKMIGKMEPDDRCRLTRCSKLCSKEAKSSKNYIYEVRFDCRWPTDITIDVNYLKYNGDMDRKLGFILRFFEQSGKKLRTYESIDNWGISNELELNCETDMFEYAINELKQLLQSYQQSIRKFSFTELSSTNEAYDLASLDFGIENWGNLENLYALGDIDVRQIFSKLQNPLKILNFHGENDAILESKEKIYKTQDDLVWWNANLNYQEFLQLRAKDVAIHLGKMTEKDVFMFIRSWQNGTLGKEIRNYQWILKNSNFDKQNFLRLLRVSDPEDEEIIEIKHYTIPGKSATLMFYFDNILRFNAGLVEDFRRLLVW